MWELQISQAYKIDWGKISFELFSRLVEAEAYGTATPMQWLSVMLEQIRLPFVLSMEFQEQFSGQIQRHMVSSLIWTFGTQNE